MTTFSQNKEDALYVPILPDHGRLMEIGAYDPVELSNSRALISKGWDAVLVDANPKCLQKLIEFYRVIEPRENVKVVDALVTAEATSSIIPFQVCWDAVSTTEKHHFDLWKGTVNFMETHSITTPVEQLFTAFPGFYDFVSIDVEGCSFELSKYVFDAVRPLVICVEHQGFDKEEIFQFAALRNYTVVSLTSENFVFQRFDQPVFECAI